MNFVLPGVQVEKGPMWQLLFWISFAEIILFPTVIDMDKKDREPGDFALDPLNLCKVGGWASHACCAQMCIEASEKWRGDET